MYSQNTYRKTCEQCGCEFTSQKSTAHYCSSRCANIARRHRRRDERLKGTALEVRERERLALLDKDYLTLSDAARMLQMSRNTLYKIVKEHGIKLQRFTVRTVRIAREDLDRIAAECRQDSINSALPPQEEDLGRWMTREQVMEKYDVTYSWFYSVLKKRGVKTRMIGSLGFYDRDTMHRLFANQDYSHITEWYTFDQLRQATGIRTESICDFVKEHKIPKMKKNGVTYVSKPHWDDARGNNFDTADYYTILQISQTYGLSRNHLYTLLKEAKINRIKRGNFVYFPRQEVDRVLADRKQKEK